MAIHLNNKALALIDNKNNTKIICYLDRGEVCGFVFGGGNGGRVHLVNNLTEIFPLHGRHLPLPARPHNIPLLLGLVAAVGGIHHFNWCILQCLELFLVSVCPGTSRLNPTTTLFNELFLECPPCHLIPHL